MDDEDKHEPKDGMNEAETNDNTVLVEKALRSFCCYLYVGKGRPYYKAKPWNDDDLYPIAERLRCVEVLATNKQTELVPIDKIKLAMDTKLARRPDTLMFALAMCARQKKSEKLRAAAYYFLVEHCKEWKYFILFVKYASILSKSEGCTGWGRGWKNAVNKWYLTKDARTLAELVTSHKGNHGWTHKDILKLSHPETTGLEVEKQAILCYIVRGLDKAKVEYGSHPEAKKILEYIEVNEYYKKCEDCSIVAHSIDIGVFAMDQAHPKTLKSEEVWCAALKRMDVRTLLKNISKLNDLGFLTEDSPATELVVQSLTNPVDLLWNEVLPGDIISVLNRQENCRFPIKRKEPITPPMKMSTRINDALKSALDVVKTVNITGSGKQKYLVSVRFPTRRRTSLCTQAGLAIALPLFHRSHHPDSSITLVSYDANKPRTSLSVITKNMSFDEALTVIHDPLPEKRRSMEKSSHPLEWVREKNKKYDVFIDVTDEWPTERDRDEIARYIKSSNDNKARLINVVVNNRTSVESKDNVWPDGLTINGFDPNVPWIIEAYVRGLF